MRNYYDMLDCTVIQFINNAEELAAISMMVGSEIRVDYSTEKPILKIGELEFNEGDYVIKTPDGVLKADKDVVEQAICEAGAVEVDAEQPLMPVE